MKFTTLLSALALAAASQLAAAAPAPAPAPAAALEARDIWTPTMTYPAKGTVWESGKTYTVRWETKDAPVNVTGADSGFILLRSGDEELPLVLAHNITLRDGHVQVTAPQVVTGNDYSLVLFGDSGNWGPQFTIKGPIPI
ncbi:GPI anchored serine-threonine rich family protein [Phanerochaete sordida]|uniref:GPI anchored serine-threonine rich family protein n=1 Tax=Phanerochaete sordida TaxID=48140 RepID=A0A9P3LII5_9APHY|nr:GPI anchored serine-threonine rich family protein [Phanerochaete sordida]